MTNHNNVICLPVMSNNRVSWVHSNEVYLKVPTFQELENAFDEFPYPTQNRMHDLARRCFMHPGQVRIWFMSQRLQYGVSWDSKDICTFREKMNSSKTGGEEAAKKQLEKGKNKLTGLLMKLENIEDKGTKKRGSKQKHMNEGNKQKKVRVTSGNKQKKCAQRTLDEKQPLIANLVPGNLQDTLKKVKPCGSTSSANCTQSKEEDRKHKGTKKRGEKWKKMEAKMRVTSGDRQKKCALRNLAETQSLKKKKKKNSSEMTNNLAASKKPKLCAAPAPSPSSPKTDKQRTGIRKAFLEDQYPDQECYCRLVELLGMNHKVVVKWFNDTRYLIKQKKPSWMSSEQHKKALANIRHKQAV